MHAMSNVFIHLTILGMGVRRKLQRGSASSLSARDSIYTEGATCYCPSVRPSVCHAGGWWISQKRLKVVYWVTTQASSRIKPI